jgi:hypothetical protein
MYPFSARQLLSLQSTATQSLAQTASFLILSCFDATPVSAGATHPIQMEFQPQETILFLSHPLTTVGSNTSDSGAEKTQL